MEWHCAQADCPLHPIYIEQERIVENKRIQEQLELREKEEARYLGRVPVGISSLGGIEGDLMFDSKTGEIKVMTSGTFMPATGLASTVYDPNYTHNHSIMMDSSWVSETSTTTIETENTPYPVPFECLMCKHMEKPDMRDIIIVNKAKKALEED